MATYFPELSGAIMDAIVYDEPLFRKTVDFGASDKIDRL